MSTRLLLALAAVCPLLAAAPAQAAFSTVDRTDDPSPASANACTDAPADCSLRGAIVAANLTVAPDEIVLAAGTYVLTRGTQGEDAALEDDLDVTGELTITGAGARSTIVAGGPAPFAERIFDVHAGAKATLTGLTVTGGRGLGGGGGIYSRGELTLEGVAVRGNTTTDGGSGGGIASEGGLTMARSTVSGNTAQLHGGGLVVFGVAATITNSTISGNRALQLGGGILALSTVLGIRSSTIAGNESGGLGGGITSALATVVVKGTIVGGNSVENCERAQFDGIIRSQGANLSSDRSCPFADPGDRRGVRPLLGPLQDNGGPTDTRALLAGSPALDGGVRAGCPAADQRGVARPQGLRCDIGAFERVNRRPLARGDVFAGRANATLRVPARGVLRNDRDPDGDRLQATLVRGPAAGKLALKRNGAFVYTPPRGFSGTVRFRYRAGDGHGGRDAATVRIAVRR